MTTDTEPGTGRHDGPGSTLRGRHLHRWLHVSLPLLIAFSVAQLSKSSIGVIVADGPFSHQFGLDRHPGSVGWLTSLFLYAYGIALFAWGFVLKRLGPRTSMLIGTAIWVVALALPPFVNTLNELYGTRILLAIGEACFYPVAHTLTARWFPMHERARANASWLSGIFVGSALGSSLTTTMLSSAGWRVTFFVQAVVAALFAFCVVLVLLQDRPDQAHGVSEQEVQHIVEGRFESTTVVPKRGPESPFRNYRYWLTMLMYIGTNAPFYGLVTWVPLYLRDERHVDLGDIGLLLTVANVLSIVVMVLVGRASDRKVKRAGWAAWGFAIEGLGIAGTALFHNAGVDSFFIFLGLAGNAWCVVTNWSLLHSLMPTRQSEYSSSVFASLTNLVGAALPGLMGTLLTATGSYTAGFGVLFLSVVVSLCCCLVLRPQGY
ncbi:MFS transporter [Streptomyces sulfonofaciens]|uniref:MFS transporter n=1 Tax=Streptomyces sulfonofaciens TaxID=68272 RepID=A0A919L3N9_9ACTN|nr:MFS transporter [Streptomyces sulfonofaciens]GHH83785.1 MFS transporter [Streptomyces sulfonofaciens]